MRGTLFFRKLFSIFAIRTCFLKPNQPCAKPKIRHADSVGGNSTIGFLLISKNGNKLDFFSINVHKVNTDKCVRMKEVGKGTRRSGGSEEEVEGRGGGEATGSSVAWRMSSWN